MGAPNNFKEPFIPIDTFISVPLAVMSDYYGSIAVGSNSPLLAGSHPWSEAAAGQKRTTSFVHRAPLIHQCNIREIVRGKNLQSGPGEA